MAMDMDGVAAAAVVDGVVAVSTYMVDTPAMSQAIGPVTRVIIMEAVAAGKMTNKHSKFV